MRMAAAAMLAAAITAPATAATVKDGVDAWQRGDYAAAVNVWRPQAEAGDADAAFNLAQAYKLGRGVPADLGQAKTWYGKAAQAGHVQGAANYGLLLFQDGDRKSAMPWIIKASDAGDPRAQYVYGTALFNGDLAPRDWPAAYALMTRAAAAGLPQATTSLSQMDQYLSAEDRRKGLDIATQLASRPVPPTSRQLVMAGEPRTPSHTTASVAMTPLASIPVPAPSPAASTWTAATPKPAPAAGPRPAPSKAVPAWTAPSFGVAGGKWQVQLGAYGTQAGATAAWSKLMSVLRGLHPTYEKAGAVVRLRAGPLADRDSAARACASARSTGAACFPVAP